MKTHRKGPRSKRPNLRRVVYRDQGGTTEAVFEVPRGVTTRSAVETLGTPRYASVCGRWKPWGGVTPPWADSWGSSRQLNEVPLAEPDAPRALAPAAFLVDVSIWCALPSGARAELQATVAWSKGPGVMRTGPLDGPTAERVRVAVAQHSIAGVEEIESHDPHEAVAS